MSSAATAKFPVMPLWMDESSLKPGCPAASESTCSKRWFTNDRIGSTERKLAVIWRRSALPIAVRAMM